MKTIVHATAISFIVLFASAQFSAAQYGPDEAMGPYGAPVGTQGVAAAQQQVRTAQEQVDRLERSAREELAADPAYAAALQERDDAIARRDAAKEQVLEELRNSPSYSAVVAKLEAADALLHGEASLTERQIVAATDDAIDARLAIAQMETAALKGSREYQNAEARVRIASNHVEQLWREYGANNLLNNRTYRAAQNALEDAQADLRDAQNAVRIARQQAAAQQTMQPRQRTRQGGGGEGGRTRGSRASRY